MYKSAMVHLINKFPGSKITADDHTIDVHDADGVHRIAMRRNGAGMWVDFGKQLGCTDAFCLAPIPKQTRLFKEYPDGSIDEHEQFEARAPIAAQLIKDGRVPSIAELVKAGIPVDSEGNVQGLQAQQRPAAIASSPSAPTRTTADMFSNAQNF